MSRRLYELCPDDLVAELNGQAGSARMVIAAVAFPCHKVH